MLTKLKPLKNHQGFMKYFKNTSWLFAEKILRMIVGLFVGIWVARYLGPEQFGFHGILILEQVDIMPNNFSDRGKLN